MKTKIEFEGDGGGGWERLTGRLSTLRAVGGLPAIRLEFTKYPDKLLDKISEVALCASVTTELPSNVQCELIELAALIGDVQHKRSQDKENEDG